MPAAESAAASPQKVSAYMPRPGMKLYSCMSRVQRVLSKSYMIATDGCFRLAGFVVFVTPSSVFRVQDTLARA